MRNKSEFPSTLIFWSLVPWLGTAFTQGRGGFGPRRMVLQKKSALGYAACFGICVNVCLFKGGSFVDMHDC